MDAIYSQSIHNPTKQTSQQNPSLLY
jgi:hypothetical protein